MLQHVDLPTVICMLCAFALHRYVSCLPCGFNPPRTHNQILHIWANISDHQGQAFEKASGCSVIQEVHHIKVNLDFPGSTVNGAYIPHQDLSNAILIREIY